MNKPVPTGSSESQISYTADFLTAFNLSFYTQLAEVVNNPKSQIYKIGLGTVATARCLLQVSELSNTSSKTRQEHRTFSILMHVRLDDALAAKSLCEKITSEFLETSYKLTTYGVEITKTLPKWNREVITKYPIALRINGLVPQESAQDVLYNILEVIALRWVELGNLAGKARGFLGDDRQNRSKKPKWGVLMPGLTHFWIRAQVTDDIRATLEDRALWNRAVWPWKYHNEENPLIWKANNQRLNAQNIAIYKYHWLVQRVLDQVYRLGWYDFDESSSESEILTRITELTEVFIPNIVVTKIIHGEEWDFYELETGNRGINSIGITLLESQKDTGKNIMKGVSRKLEFTCGVDPSQLEALTRVAKFLSEESVAYPLDIKVEVRSWLTPEDKENIEELPGWDKIGSYENTVIRLVVTSFFGSNDTIRFESIIQTIMIALDQNGFPLMESGTGSNTFGFLKIGANERGWINSLIQKGQQYSTHGIDVGQEKRKAGN